jgi:cytochrome c oxidase cbb3-type subunit 4
MAYEDLARFAQTWGLLYFLIIFLGICVYAFWPGNQRRFDEAAAMPLQDRED